jgi:Regulator of ribonuclease activity B
MIELAQLEEMFASIAARGKWDMSQPMLWGYFFTDNSKEKLESVIPALELQGCRYVDIFVPELDEDQEPYYFLHVEKEEAHSPASLFEKNAQFYALAKRHDLGSYDGMDVGPLQRR